MRTQDLPTSDVPPHWWQWPTILSLDAPAVALLWQWELARCAGSVPGGAAVLVLGASVWLAYVADRWIEGWRLDPDCVRTQRHRFHSRRRWPIAVVWCGVLAADLRAAWTGLGDRELAAGVFLLGAVLAYLLSHQLVHRHHPWRLPKEICVAGLLGCGVALFVAVPRGAARGPIAVPVAFFVLLCFANCALISVWEHAVDRSHGQTSFALQFRNGARISRALPWAVAAASGLSWWGVPPAAGPAVLCAGAGGALLGAVDLLQPRLGWQLARVLADVALMVPVAQLAAAWAPRILS
jgi:hypothetical protein